MTVNELLQAWVRSLPAGERPELPTRVPALDVVCSGVTHGLTEVSVRTGVPIGFGVLTCDDDAQALDRAGLPGSREDKGHEAAMAAVATAVTLGRLAPRTLGA